MSTDDSAPKASKVGILASLRAKNAASAIENSEGLVTILRLTQADLRPAEDAINVAKQLYDTSQFTKALQTARQAEAIAITLDERFSGYQKAVTTLYHSIDELRRIGFPTEEHEGLVGRAEEKVVTGIWENGAFVPNYLEAKVLLDRGDHEARAILDKAQRASTAIFLGELAVEALVDMQGPADPKTFGEGAGATLEQTLEEATRHLALGDLDAAIRVAMDLEDRATQLRAEYIDADRTLTATETQLADLRGEGIATERIERQVDLARDLLARGMIDTGMTLAKRLDADTRSLGVTFRRATTGLLDVEILYAKLNRDGFHSYEAESAIRDARRSIRAGAYGRGIEHLERAFEAFARRKNVRASLEKAIEDTRARVRTLEGNSLPFLPDVQELLGRAEREFRDGNFSGSSEDLRIATLLLGERPKGDGPKR